MSGLHLKEIDGVLTLDTICTNCRWHKNIHDSNDAGRDSDADWNNICTEPSLEAQLSIHPVSGKRGYMRKNDLGGIYLCQEKHPNCAAVNKGNCAFYQERVSSDVRKMWSSPRSF